MVIKARYFKKILNTEKLNEMKMRSEKLHNGLKPVITKNLKKIFYNCWLILKTYKSKKTKNSN